MKKSVGFASIVLLFLAIVVIELVPLSYAYEPGTLKPPLIIIDHRGSPQEWIAPLIQHEGGLPKTNG